MLQAGMPHGDTWWQIVTGILAIPAAMLGLVYTYRLYQKTQLEIRELHLKIIERERQLGVINSVRPELDVIGSGPSYGFVLEDVPKRLPSHTTFDDTSSERDETPPAAKSAWRVNHDHLVWTSYVLGPLVVLLAPRPSPFPISKTLGLTSAILFGLFAVIVVMCFRRPRGRGAAWIVAAAATVSFIIAVASWITYATFDTLKVATLHGSPNPIRIVVGNRLTPAAEHLLAAQPQLSVTELLYSLSLQPGAVWSAPSQWANAVWLLASFNLALLATFAFVLSVIHLRLGRRLSAG